MADYFGQFVDPEDEKRKRRTTAADTQDFFGQFLPPEPKGAKPGIVSDIKRGFGQMIGGIGSSIRDLGAEELGQNIENYGTDIARRHPSEINSFQDVLESPLTTAREATGEQVSQLGSMFTGMRLGALIGSPLGPVGQIAGGFIGGLTPLALQTYGGIRQEQRIAGIDDKGRAILATVPSVALERLGGPEKLVSKFSRLGLGGMAREAGEAGLSLPGYVGRQALKGGAVETITEIPQTALERYGAYKDLLSPEAVDEYGVAGAKAFAGGGVYSGGFAAITPRVPAADTAGTPGTESSSAQRQLFTTNTEGMASPLNTQQVTELADVRDMLRARMQAAESRPETSDPLEYKEMRETVERIERILAGTQSDQMTLDLDPFRYSAGLQGRKERTPSRTNFQKSLFAPEVGPDFGAGSAEAPLDLLVPGQYTPTSETIALPQVSTREAYARAVEKAKRGESLSKLEEYLLENPPESAGVMTSETGAGTMQQRMLAGPQAFRDPVTAASGMRTRTQEPTQMDMFGNPIDLNQATTLQPGLSVAPMQDTPLTNLQQSGQTEMFDGRGQPTYNAAPVGTTTLAEARLRAEGAIPTTKRMEIAVKAEEALAAGTIDEPTYDQIFTLLRESKYAKASKLVGETSVAQTTQTKQAEAQRSQAPVAGTAPATAPTVEQPTVAEVPNAVQVKSPTEVPVQPRAETGARVGEEVRRAQEPTAASRQKAEQTEEVDGYLSPKDAVNRLVKEAGVPRADAKNMIEAIASGFDTVPVEEVDQLVKENAPVLVKEEAVEVVAEVATDWDTKHRTDRRTALLVGASKATRAFVETANDTPTQTAVTIPATTSLRGAVASLLDFMRPTSTLLPTVSEGQPAPKKEYPLVLVSSIVPPAKRDVPFVLLMREGVVGQPLPTDVVGVLVNPAHPKLVAPLQEALPTVEVRSFTDASSVETDVPQLFEVRSDGRVEPTLGAMEEASGGLDTRTEPTMIAAADNNTIEGQTRWIDALTLQPLVEQIPPESVRTLEQHYKLKADTAKFLAKLRDDVSNYVTKGAQSVAAAIRSIIKTLATAVLATAVIVNPNFFSRPVPVAVPQTVVTQKQVLDAVPASVANQMSDAAKTAYANIMPAIKAQLKAQNKFFVLTDKQTARVFIFTADGEVVLNKKVLLGKTIGDYYKGDTEGSVSNRITPAGLFNLGLRDAKRGITEWGGNEAATAGDYDFQKVFVLDKAGPGGEFSVTLFHSVWTKESDAKQRLAALGKEGAEDSRYSFGCINVDKASYEFLINNYLNQMDGAKMFVVPDKADAVMSFVSGEATQAKDLQRQSVKPVTKTETTTTTEKSAVAERGQEQQGVLRREEQPRDKAKPKDGKGPQFSRGTKTGKSTVQQVNSWIEATKKLWGNAAPTEVVQTTEDLTAATGLKDIPVDAKGLFYDGKVYIVADNHGSRVDTLVTYFHEMIGHYGLRSLVRPESTEYVRLMTKIESQNEQLRKNAAEWRKNNPNNIQYLKDKFGYTDTMIRAVSVEEAMADMAYEALQNPELRTKLAKSPMLRTLTSWISKALRAIGMAPIADKVDALNSNLDVFALLSLSRDFVERGQKPSVMEATNVPMFSRGGVASAPETGQLYGDYGKMVAEVMVGKIKRAAMNFRFLRDLRRSYGNKLAGLSDYVDKAFAMGAMTNQLLKDGGQIVSRWGALGQELEPVNELASFASAMEIYPDLPLDSATHDSNGRKLTNAHLLDESGNVSTEIEAAHAQLQEMWRKLSPTARKVYLDARDYLHKTWMQRQDLLNKNVDAIFNPLIAEAKRLGNDAKVKALTKERNKQVAEFGKVLAQLKGPYFPSERFGDYYVSYKSDEFKAAEAELDDATQALADLYGTHDIPMNMKREIEAAEKALSAMGEDPSLFGLTAKTRQEIKDARKAVAVARAKVAELTKAGEKHYTNESFESEIAAKLRAKELGVGVRMAQEYFRELNPVTRGMVEKMADAVGGTLPEAQAVKAREAITQIYLAALPQTSALKAQIKRKGVAGADQDMLRVFSSRVQKDAHYLSRLAYMDDMTAEMLRMQKDRKTQEQDAIYNQMAKHHTASLQYSKTPIQDGLSSLAFVYQLGVSPAFLLSNMTQPFMVSVPYMSGKHNPGKASAAMFSAFADAGRAAAASFKKDGLHFEIGLDKFAGAEKAMLESAMREGLLDITLEMDIGAYAKGGSGLTSRAMRMMGVLPHQVEVVNRVATALAAYRLELARTSNEAQATEYAKEVLDKTHFDYSTTNAPYLMKPGVVPLGKLLFQYRKYQIGMLTLMGNLTRDAIKSSDPVEKAQARRALLGTFVTYGLFTGASGLPFVGTGFFIAKLLGAIFGDDDEPNDPEADFRQYLADLFGVDGGVIAAKGLPALLGVDASRILGAGDIAAPIRSIRWDKEGRNLYTEILIAGLGPTLGGLGPQFAEGLRYLDEGDYYRGAQNLTPRFIRDGLKAMQMADDGVTTTKGQQVMEPEEIAASDIMLQAFGVPTTFVTERQAAARAIQDAKQTITDRRKLLMRNFVKARIDGDNEGMQDAREAINKFNETRRARGEPIIKWKDLTAAYKQRRTYAKNMNKYGVSLGKKERAFEEYGNFAAMDNED